MSGTSVILPASQALRSLTRMWMWAPLPGRLPCLVSSLPVSPWVPSRSLTLGPAPVLTSGPPSPPALFPRASPPLTVSQQQPGALSVLQASPRALRGSACVQTMQRRPQVRDAKDKWPLENGTENALEPQRRKRLASVHREVRSPSAPAAHLSPRYEK